MKVSIEELKLRCLIALKELSKRGIKVKSDVNKMSRKQLAGEWGRLSAILDRANRVKT